jgi:putative flippase GtrA
MRKFFGIVLICFGGLITLIACISTIPNILKTIQGDLDYINKSAYLLGTFIGFALIMLLPYWLIKKGIQLTKKKKVEVGHIEKIMSIK